MSAAVELNADRLNAQLQAEPLRPVYLVAGSETLLVLEAADAIRAAARAQGVTEREVYELEDAIPTGTRSRRRSMPPVCSPAAG